MITNEKILIFGGSGSLGHELVSKYVKNNTIVNFSRDECKQWAMTLKFKTPNLTHIIGDIRCYDSVTTAIRRTCPTIIIVASALKHIDLCEYAVEECVKTNYNGFLNVVNCVERYKLRNITVVFISTDKSCSPINAYGFSKSLSEKVAVEKSLYVPSVKFVTVRYGNVLNSRGSIIPILHEKGQDAEVKEFSLTHNDMTRFVMTLEQSVDLIEYAIQNAESGDIVIPTLVSMRVRDLIELFSEKYNKPIKITGLRPGEKLLESLINETQSMSMIQKNGYYHIKPPYKNICNVNQAMDYNSKINPLTKTELAQYLVKLGLY